ncbi:hypothetical protein SAMN02745136_00096 [Anaerocolumna jejuensis DSM 15929]|uniref:Uncharacterized protein n=1 Tax=Anaerocolumna jejuensis DSM 15929 TaxID=1121322 RepID=A0A1M6JIQ8_9FIRM|nr:hypothetical protein [Anaerocolumna jejuensis]SHJ46556.1 hypothetical protein SAMN02745136_00096 [Anaerocolumna jejuensis DSM 15929]
MDALVGFIMGSSTSFDIYVAIRLAIVFALIDMIKCVTVSLVKGVK